MGILEAAQRRGTGDGRANTAIRGREARRDQEWTRRCKYFRKQYVRLMRAAGVSEARVEAVFEAAANHNSTELMTRRDVDTVWAKKVTAITRMTCSLLLSREATGPCVPCR